MRLTTHRHIDGGISEAECGACRATSVVGIAEPSEPPCLVLVPPRRLTADAWARLKLALIDGSWSPPEGTWTIQGDAIVFHPGAIDAWVAYEAGLASGGLLWAAESPRATARLVSGDTPILTGTLTWEPEPPGQPVMPPRVGGGDVAARSLRHSVQVARCTGCGVREPAGWFLRGHLDDPTTHVWDTTTLCRICYAGVTGQMIEGGRVVS